MVGRDKTPQQKESVAWVLYPDPSDAHAGKPRWSTWWILERHPRDGIPLIIIPFGRLVQKWDHLKPLFLEWLNAHTADLQDILRHQRKYPGFVVWSLLNVFRLADDITAQSVVEDFLLARVLNGVRWQGQTDLEIRRGYKDEDVRQELLLHLTVVVLADERRAVKHVVAYLRQAAKRRLLNLLREAETRPALMIPEVPEGEVAPDTSLDEVLSGSTIPQPRRALGRKRISSPREVAQRDKADLKRLRIEQRWQKLPSKYAAPQPLGAQELEEVEAADLLPRQLSPREKQLAGLVLRGDQPADAAKHLGVKAQTVETMRRRMKRKLQGHPLG